MVKVKPEVEGKSKEMRKAVTKMNVSKVAKSVENRGITKVAKAVERYLSTSRINSQ